jgi:hypothetical protein
MGDESARPDAAVHDTAGTQQDATTRRRIVVPDEVRATVSLPAAERAAALRTLAEPRARRRGASAR